MLENSKLKKTALAQLKNRWTIPLVAAFAAETVSFLLSIIKNNLPDKDGISFLFFIFTQICSAIFSFASLKVCFTLTKIQEPISFSDYTESFTQWLPAVLAKIWSWLWITIWSLIIVIPASFIFILSYGISLMKNFDMETMQFNGNFNFDSLDSGEFFKTMFTDYLGLAILMIVILFALLIMIIYKTIQYGEMRLVIAEHKKVSVRKAMRISIEIMKGHKAEKLGLDVSFLGWLILASVPFFFKSSLAKLISEKPASLIISLITTITFSLVVPYIATTKANFYNAVMNEAIASGKIKPEDLQ